MCVSSGVVMQRWRPSVQDSRCDLEVVLWANHVQVTNEQRTSVQLTQELVRIEYPSILGYLYRHLVNLKH